MKYNLNNSIPALTFIFSTVLLISCAGTRQIPIWEFDQYLLDSESIQTKSGLTIEVEPLTPANLYEHPELFSFTVDELPKKWHLNVKAMYPEGPQGKRWEYTFGFGDNFLAAMKVKITNQTGHILRMGDARIYLRIEGEDPIKAITKLGNTQLEQVDEKGTLLPKSREDESLVHWLTYFANEWDIGRKKGILSLVYPVGLPSQIIKEHKKKYKLISDVNLEILPGDHYSGLLLFPVIISSNETVLKMYDLTTKTDAAGNPTEKVTFEFKLKFNKGKKWFDRLNNEWKNGEPPEIAPSS